MVHFSVPPTELGEELNGLQIAETLLKEHDIPLVFITEQTDLNIIDRIDKITSYGILAKNSGEAVLLSSLRTIFDLIDTKKELKNKEVLQQRLIRSHKDILNNAVMGILIVRDGKILWANSRAAEISGYSNAELLSLPFLESIHPEDREMVKKFHHRQEEDIDPLYLSCRFFNKTGDVRWIELNFRGINWSGKQADLCFANDITDRKKTEEELNLKSLIMEQIKDRITITNLKGEITYINKAETLMLGLSKNEVIGKKTDIYGEDDKRGATQKEILETALQKGSWRGEVINFGIDGKEHILDCRVQTIMDSNGKPIALCGISTEVTEQRRIEKKTRESEARFRRLAENAQDLIYRYDFLPERRFAYVSPSAEEITGFTPEEHYADPDLGFKLIHPEDRHTLEKLSTDTEFTRKPLTLRWIKKDGTIVWIEQINIPVFDDQDNLIALEGIARDVTEQKKSEDALKESEERFSAFMDNLPITTFIKDKEHRLIYVNNEMKKAFSASDWIGKTPYDILPEDIAQKLIDADNKSFEQGYGVNEHTIPDKSGRERIWETHVFRIDRENKEPLIGGFSIDISERKQAEEELREQQALLTAIYRNAPLVLMVVDCERRIQQVNGFAAQFANREIEEMLGLRGGEALRCLHALDDPKGCGFGDFCQQCVIRNTVLDTLETGETHLQVEAPYYFQENEFKIQELIFLVSTTPIKVKDKRMVLVSLHDITERKKNEEEIKKAVQEWKTTFNATKDVIWISDKENNILRINKAVESLFGITPEEVLGKKCWEIVHKTDEPIAGCPNERAKKSLDRKTMELCIEERWFEISVDPIIDKDGEYNGAVHIVSDITARKKTEEALRLSEERYRMFTELASDYVFIIELNEDKQAVIAWTNESMRNALNYAEEEIRTMEDLFRLVYPEDRIIAEEIAIQSFEGKEVNKELRLITKDGEILSINLYTKPVFDEKRSRVLKVYGAAKDITDEKELHQQLLQAQKMESVGRLAGGVAHDFNNMLGVIIGNVDMAIGQVNKEHEIYSQLTDVRKAANRSADLTRQLLAFARKQIITPKIIDLNTEIKSMTKLLKRLIVEEIDLIHKKGENLWSIKIDPVQIDQILTNLCINAQDAIKGAGKITLETSNITIDSDFCLSHPDYKQGDYVLLSVSDTGSGMGKETLRKMFEPYYTTKDIGQGTGMGLATVYGIIKQNDGIIEVYSEIDKGTVFKMYLPRYEAKEEVKEKTEGTLVLQKGDETILLVEDEPSLLQIITTMLDGLGYRVISANSSSEAIKKAYEFKDDINLLLTDVVIPEMNGRDLADTIQQLKPDIKVIFMSGYTSDVITHRGVLDDNLYFIQKPFTMRKIAELLREVLDE